MDNSARWMRMNTIVRTGSRVLLVLFAIVASGVIAIAMALYFYRNEIKQGLIRELNKRLLSEIKIKPQNISVSLISSFPDCSVEFRNMLMLEAVKQKKDTLFFCRKINFCFSVTDLWYRRYRIKKITLHDG